MPLPVVLQGERAECGIACLAMVAGFHGYRSTLRELRSKFRLSLRGMTLRRLRDCAQTLGFACRGVRLEMDELSQIRTPAILHWELDHFVVLKSAKRRSIVVVDPAVGLRRLTHKEAGSSFTGVALEVSPTPEFQEKREVESIRLTAFLAPLKGLGSSLAAVFSMTVLLQAFALVMPLNMQFTVDHGIRQGDTHIVVALAVGFGLLAFISAVTSYLRSLFLLYVGNTSAMRMVGGLAHHLLRLPDAWFSARHTGDVLSRFGSIAPIRRFLTTGAFGMVVDALMAVGAFAVAMAYAWDMVLVLCGFLLVFATLNAATYAPLRNLNHESIAASALESTSFIENVQRHRAIKLLGAEADREDAWGERYVNSLNAGARLGRFGLHVGLAGSAIGNVDGVDFDIEAGEFVAITGESGKGKTTLIKLLTKLLAPVRGEIRVDGVALKRLDTVDYRHQLGVVMQDDDLFSGSLLENIAAGETQPDLERAERVARLACIHEDIERMPMQYLTLVGHMGSTLSGGQRQRLMIARAVYREPRILLLDEGTAHLNDELQRRLLDNLASLGVTIIAVTHDPRVIDRADRCIRL